MSHKGESFCKFGNRWRHKRQQKVIDNFTTVFELSMSAFTYTIFDHNHQLVIHSLFNFWCVIIDDMYGKCIQNWYWDIGLLTWSSPVCCCSVVFLFFFLFYSLSLFAGPIYLNTSWNYRHCERFFFCVSSSSCVAGFSSLANNILRDNELD